jgi:hypothetical protein
MSVKSQVGMEFLSVIMFIFVVFTIFYIGVNDYLLDVYGIEKQFLSRDVALRVHGELFLAYRAQDGYERNFTLPDKLVGVTVYDYNITITNNTLIVLTDQSEVDYPVPLASGTLNKGGVNNLRKVNGGLILE